MHDIVNDEVDSGSLTSVPSFDDFITPNSLVSDWTEDASFEDYTLHNLFDESDFSSNDNNASSFNELSSYDIDSCIPDELDSFLNNNCDTVSFFELSCNGVVSSLEVMDYTYVSNEPLEFMLWTAGRKRANIFYRSQHLNMIHDYVHIDADWLFSLRTETGTRRLWFHAGDLEPIGLT